jgi:MYXO-CTERM domain-containing protein
MKRMNRIARSGVARCLAFGLAGMVTVSHASSAVSTATATLSGFTITLTDTNPLDGRGPAITFLDRAGVAETRVFAKARAGGYEGGFYSSVDEDQATRPFTPVSAGALRGNNASDAHLFSPTGTLVGTTLHAQALAATIGLYGIDEIFYAEAAVNGRVTNVGGADVYLGTPAIGVRLAPYTLVTITANASLGIFASYPFVTRSEAQATLGYGPLGANYASAVDAAKLDSYDARDLHSLTLTDRLSISFASGAAGANGSLVMRVAVLTRGSIHDATPFSESALAVRAVPEPATVAQWAAGLLLVGLLTARRRQKPSALMRFHN